MIYLVYASFDVFPHVDHHVLFRYLKEIHRVLKIGGRAFLSTSDITSVGELIIPSCSVNTCVFIIVAALQVGGIVFSDKVPVVWVAFAVSWFI